MHAIFSVHPSAVGFLSLGPEVSASVLDGTQGQRYFACVPAASGNFFHRLRD
jgi:hypothetical protein